MSRSNGFSAGTCRSQDKGAQQAINIGSPDVLPLAIQGIVDIAKAVGLVAGEEDKADLLARHAIEEMQAEKPEIGGIERFFTWLRHR